MIRIVWGTGAARTAKASFDVALSEAGLHRYNLRELSSVVPAGVPVERVGTAPDLGPTGGVLDAVVARQTSRPDARAAAGLAWAQGEDGAGVFYEAADHDLVTVEESLTHGIRRGCALRGIDEDAVEVETVVTDPVADEYATAVVLAVYGESSPLL